MKNLVLSFFKNIKEALFPAHHPKKFDNSFLFPYSEDKAIKQQQVWDNLQKGILFEDTGVFLPWVMPFSYLGKYAEQRKDKGDRTEWFLGKHQILDGYTCYVGVMKWVFVNDSKPFSEIVEWLGFDYEGNKKFLFLKDKLTDLLGHPAFMELEKFGDFDLGSVGWNREKVKIRLSGIEQFACKYRLSIGLTENQNQ